MTISNNERIDYLRATIAYFCPMKCKYCYIDTYKSDIIDANILKDYIKKLLSSQGDYKVLGLIGGETFLFPDLLRDIIDFSRQQEAIYKKTLTIYVVTSGIIAPIKLLQYLSENNVATALSLDGESFIHDKNRILKNDSGSLELVLKNKEFFLKYFPKNLFGISMTVAQDTSPFLYRSFLYLYSYQGFNYCFTIVPVKGPSWTSSNEQVFLGQLKKILSYVLYSIEKQDYIYIYGLMSHIYKKSNDKRYSNSQIECNIFPDGKIKEELIDADEEHFFPDLKPIYSKYSDIIIERSLYNKNYQGYISNMDTVLFF